MCTSLQASVKAQVVLVECVCNKPPSILPDEDLAEAGPIMWMLVSLSLTLGLVDMRKPPFSTSPLSPFPLPLGTCGLPVLQGHGEHRSLLQACQEQGYHLCNSHTTGGDELVLFMECGQKQFLPTWGVPEGTKGAVGPGAFPTLISAPEQPLRSDSSSARHEETRDSSRV